MQVSSHRKQFSIQSFLEFINYIDISYSFQAPSVSSSHQSKLSVRQSDDTETMMSQVYSQQGTITVSP